MKLFFYGRSTPLSLFVQERLLSVSSKSVCMKLWLTAFSNFSQEKKCD